MSKCHQKSPSLSSPFLCTFLIGKPWCAERARRFRSSRKRLARHAMSLINAPPSEFAVLISGGYNSQNGEFASLASAEIFDPTTQTFRPAGAMANARTSHLMILKQSHQNPSEDDAVVLGGGQGVVEWVGTPVWSRRNTRIRLEAIPPS